MRKITLVVFISAFISACGGGSSSEPEPTPPTTPAPDNVAPVITLTGNDTINHEQGSDFNDPGASATDNVDGTVSVSVTGAVLSAAGTYTLTYTATDAAGNSSTVTRTVTVADTISPVISLNGDSTINHELGTDFADPGATATDSVDGNVSVTVSGEVLDLAGSYTLTYMSQDAAQNSASISRTVIVADTTAPVISLNGASTLSLTIGDTYTEQGATALDAVDGTVTVSVVGMVDTSTADTYTITYSAVDDAQNSVSVTRTVTVETAQSNDDLIVLSQGAASDRFEGGLNAFDAATNFSECSNDGGAACPSISWSVINDNERANVLEIQHSDSGDFAGFFVKTATPVDISNYSNGALLFDLKTVSGNGRYKMKLDCEFPCTSGDKEISFEIGDAWTPIIVPLASLVQSGLDLTKVDTGIVIWASAHNGDTFRLDNVRFTTSFEGDSSIGDVQDPPPVNVTYNITNYGAGSVSDTINPASYRCVFDFGNWIFNAGVVLPAISDCNTETSTPIGNPTPLSPQVRDAAASKPLASHRWWGSVSFIGEMAIGDPNSAAYITPDPITARINNAGFRMMGIPSGLSVAGNNFGYSIPDPFAEVFDGLGIANSMHTSMEAFAADHSDGSVTVVWESQGVSVMTATFVHGSPYVFIDVLDGDLVLKTLREDSGEKGVFHQNDSSLGVWTSVAGNTNYYLVTGDGATTFANSTSNQILVTNPTKSYTIALIPTTSPSSDMINTFEQYARNVIDEVMITYQVMADTNAVQVTHQYLDDNDQAVTTITGLQPMHWKNVTSPITDTGYSVRSARGLTKFANQSSFTYEMPHVGVLPALPTVTDDLDVPTLTALINEFVDSPQSQWNTLPDTYWSGKAYGKVSELIAIADALNLDNQKQQMLGWLTSELEDWFTAETSGNLDSNKYFVYDETWDTLLGMEESFSSHQQLNDHHFHYGYFVRAAAEVCRHNANWCADENYGSMVKLLIRDYAGGRDDPLFPYLRHFDPANGFSWASGNVNFARGNNNESTSEAANAYGAMVLFGLIIDDQDLIDRGMYLHASTASSYWQYWNNIDGYNTNDAEQNNFPAGYDRITTSIIWGDGASFSTWFSAAFAHILGIQGLPTNTLNLHIGLNNTYLADYVTLGLSESSNQKPSGLVDDQWRDIWWNIWAMNDAQASIADYETVSSYDPEYGETKAHTYHWLHTFKSLGHIAIGTGSLTADYPAAQAFVNNGVTSYVVYNYTDTEFDVTYSDGTVVTASANGFTVVRQ